MHSLSAVYKNSTVFICRHEVSIWTGITGDCALDCLSEKFPSSPIVPKTGLDQECCLGILCPVTPLTLTPLPHVYIRSSQTQIYWAVLGPQGGVSVSRVGLVSTLLLFSRIV